MRGMTHFWKCSVPWRCAWMRVTWLIQMWDMTYSNVGHDSFRCGTWLIQMWDMTHSDVVHDSFRCGTWLIQMWDMTHSKYHVGHFWHSVEEWVEEWRKWQWRWQWSSDHWREGVTFSLTLRLNVGLFCWNVGLFCWNVGLLWWNVGLFWWNIGHLWHSMEERLSQCVAMSDVWSKNHELDQRDIWT